MSMPSNPYESPQTSHLTEPLVATPAADVRRMFAEIDTPRLRRIVRQSVSIQAIAQLLTLAGCLILVIVAAVFWPDYVEGLRNDETSLIVTLCAGLGMVVGYGIGARRAWGRWAGIVVCGGAVLGIVVLFGRAVWLSRPEDLLQNLVVTTVLSLPAVIPGLGLDAFLRRRDLFGPQRLPHRDLAQELAFRQFSRRPAWRFQAADLSAEDRIRLGLPPPAEPDASYDLSQK